MLKQLYIKNFTLIDTLDIRFNNGFSVITGETGAGKSIILGAINLLLGQRADVKNIMRNHAKCVIEAHFDISRYGMQEFFLNNDIDYDDTDCILRREINTSGKSRAFINDVPVPLTTIKALGEQLIDIHSQHQNLLLNKEDFQLEVVDIIASCQQLLAEYKKAYHCYREAKKAVQDAVVAINESRKNEDYLRFQQKELEDAHLENGMQEQLEQENEMLSHVEEIKTALYDVDHLLSDGDHGQSLLDMLKQASRSLDNISAIYPEAADWASRIESCHIEMKDISQEIANGVENIEFDPQRLDEVNATLDKIYTLQQKHHLTSVEELIGLLNDINSQLDSIDNSDSQLAMLQERETEALDRCRQLASQLHEARMKAAKTVEEEMCRRLVPLGMPNVRFAVCIEEKPLADDGYDRISFLFSANTSTAMQPVSQVASGGEIARVMLSLKAMISGAVKLPTIIFDEIDTGVSGKIAEKMAGIMHEMAAAKRQVVSITHLPQIAAKGTTHYKVFKEEGDNGTTTRMTLLNNEERVQEIAQMLSGSEVTEAALDNARALLRQ